QRPRTRPRHPAGPAPGRLATETVERRHASLPRGTRTPAVLPRRVHLPFQSAQVNRARNAVLPTPAAKRQHRSSPTAGTHQPQARGERRQRHQPRTHPQQYLQRVLITASPLKQISSSYDRFSAAKIVSSLFEESVCQQTSLTVALAG